MGKNLIQQRRGRGSPTYRSSSHRFKGEVKHLAAVETSGQILDVIHCAGHSAPLIEVSYLNGVKSLAFAPEGIKVGDSVSLGATEIKDGNVLTLREIPEGTPIHNLEVSPGDGGKMVRASGTSARIVTKSEEGVTVLLPSKKEKLFHPECRAAIGIIAGSGRLDKPFLKAGTRYRKMRARNRLYPRVCGVSMNAVDHPFGGSSSHIKGRPTQSPRSAPPGRKVGMVAPRRTGRKR